MTTFVDTNVLVYARDLSQKEKQPKALAWMNHLWVTGHGRLSTQVLNEFYVTVTRKLQPGLPTGAARAEVQDLLAWRPVPVSSEVIVHAWAIEDRFGFSYWDSLIVAAARLSGADSLLSEDLQDGQELDGLVVINPFAHEP